MLAHPLPDTLAAKQAVSAAGWRSEGRQSDEALTRSIHKCGSHWCRNQRLCSACIASHGASCSIGVRQLAQRVSTSHRQATVYEHTWLKIDEKASIACTSPTTADWLLGLTSRGKNASTLSASSPSTCCNAYQCPCCLADCVMQAEP